MRKYSVVFFKTFFKKRYLAGPILIFPGIFQLKKKIKNIAYLVIIQGPIARQSKVITILNRLLNDKCVEIKDPL